MRFTIKREEFLKGLTTAGRAISGKSVMPILENLHIELIDKGLFITGSNLDLTIKAQVPYKLGDIDIIRNYKEGSVLIDAKRLTDIIREMDSEEVTFDVIDTTSVTISGNNNRSNYRLNGIRADEYVELDLEANGTELTMSTVDFNVLVAQTAFAASTKEKKPLLTAIHLEARGGILSATASDSARLAKKTLSIPNDVEFTANVPARIMVEITRLLEGRDSLEVAFSDNKALFTIGTTIVATRLIAGEYYKTDNVVPKNTNCVLEVNANDFIKAIKRANILSIERENAVDLSMSEESVKISAKSSTVGSATEEITDFRYEGRPLDISFNGEFVIAAIKALGCDDVTLAFVEAMKAFIIRNAADDSVIQIVTPMRSY